MCANYTSGENEKKKICFLVRWMCVLVETLTVGFKITCYTCPTLRKSGILARAALLVQPKDGADHLRHLVCWDEPLARRQSCTRRCIFRILICIAAFGNSARIRCACGCRPWVDLESLLRCGSGVQREEYKRRTFERYKQQSFSKCGGARRSVPCVPCVPCVYIARSLSPVPPSTVHRPSPTVPPPL